MATIAVSRGRLLQVPGIWFGIAAIVGNSIGAGIMRTPSEVARQLPIVNPGGTPTATLAASSLLAIAFIVTGTFSQVIAIAAFFSS